MSYRADKHDFSLNKGEKEIKAPMLFLYDWLIDSLNFRGPQSGSGFLNGPRRLHWPTGPKRGRRSEKKTLNWLQNLYNAEYFKNVGLHIVNTEMDQKRGTYANNHLIGSVFHFSPTISDGIWESWWWVVNKLHGQVAYASYSIYWRNGASSAEFCHKREQYWLGNR